MDVEIYYHDKSQAVIHEIINIIKYNNQMI